MTTNWKKDAEAHAGREYPREACGLVVVLKGRKRYVPCVNQAVGDDHFIISGEEFARAEDAGEVIAIFHSHCNVTASPSEADRVSCARSGLTWHIYALPLSEWHSFEPENYRAPLVGRPFQHGVLDCYGLIRDYYFEVRGAQLPDFARSDDWWHRGENLYLDNFGTAGFVEVFDGPQEGDVLLMQISAPVPNHAAIWLPDDLILHHLHGRLSSRDVYGEFYRKNTAKVLRHVA